MTLALRIGVLIYDLDSDYARPIVDLIGQAGAAAGVQIHFFPTRHFEVPSFFDRQFNIVAGLAKPEWMDGYLVFASLIHYGLQGDNLSELLAPFEHRPIVVIGGHAENTSSVVIDNRRSFHRLVRHLIAHHGHQAIGFISGPLTNAEAHARRLGYVDALEEAGIAWVQAREIGGAFSVASGRDAALSLLDREPTLTAIAAANDGMAYGALAAANERGLRVPEDLAIVGFDDLLSLSGKGPMLTTVNHDLRAQVDTALAQLLSEIIRNAPHKAHVIPTKLVLRQSCGCTLGRGTYSAENKSQHARLTRIAESYNEDINEQIRIVNLFTALLTQISTNQNDEAYAAMYGEALRCLRLSGSTSKFQNMLADLQTNCLLIDFPAALQQHALAQFSRCANAITRANDLHRNEDRTRQAHPLWALRQAIRRKVFSVNLQDLYGVLAEHLPALGITEAQIIFYNEPIHFQGGVTPLHARSGRVMFAMGNGQVQTQGLEMLFPVQALYPSKPALTPSTQALSIFPLFHFHEHFGYLSMNVPPHREFHFEDIRHEIATSIRSALLLAELNARREIFRWKLGAETPDVKPPTDIAEQDELTQLYNRKGFYRLAQNRLLASRRAKQPLLFVFIDLTGLKGINDKYGREEGDHAIYNMARLLQATLHAGDVVARLSEGQFIGFIEPGEGKDLGAIRARIYARFAEYTKQGNQPYTLACSLGGYSAQPNSNESLERIIAAADSNQYQEKRRQKSL